jgi:hypothetical protein
MDRIHDVPFRGSHLELGRQWKVIIFHMYFVNRRDRILKTKNLYGNHTLKTSHIKRAMITSKYMI